MLETLERSFQVWEMITATDVHLRGGDPEDGATTADLVFATSHSPLSQTVRTEAGFGSFRWLPFPFGESVSLVTRFDILWGRIRAPMTVDYNEARFIFHKAVRQALK
jgi:hypothetical protein